MAGPSAGQTLRIIVWTQAGDQAGLNMHYVAINSASGPDPDGSAFCNAIMDLIGLPYRALMSGQSSLFGVQADIVSGGVGGPYYSNSLGGPGEVAGDLLPRQTCGLLIRTSAHISKRRTFRTYVPFPGEADNDESSVPSADYMNRIDALGAVLIDNHACTDIVSGLDFTIEWKGRKVGPGGSTFEPMIGWRRRRKWATQRRRSSFGRPNVIPF